MRGCRRKPGSNTSHALQDRRTRTSTFAGFIIGFKKGTRYANECGTAFALVISRTCRTLPKHGCLTRNPMPIPDTLPKWVTMKTPQPRKGRYLGMAIVNVEFPDGSWLEGEEFCYPSGGMKRRAHARCADGEQRLFKAGIPDTFFSIPATGNRMKGFLSSDETGLKFTEFSVSETPPSETYTP